MKCYLCDKDIKGPEGAIHPAGGFGWRHLGCDPQVLVQKLDVSSPGYPEAMYETTKTGDVTLTAYGQLVTARGAQALAEAAQKGGDS